MPATGPASGWRAHAVPWPASWTRAGLAATGVAMALALYITQQATEAEQKIVRASKIALTISASGRPNDPGWAPAKAEMLRLIREGIAIDRHYRKITPIVADELARWGDWQNATWIWESVLSSRPHIVAIMSNAARGYLTIGRYDRVREYLERAKRIQPRAPAVRSLELLLLARTGENAKALELGRQAIADGDYDFDLTNTLFILAWRAKDYTTAAKAMELRLAGWDVLRPQGYTQLGTMYARDAHDPAKALESYRRAYALVSPAERDRVLAEVPLEMRADVAAAPSLPATTQTSASRG
jgi:tetratricopeptide (TPR) repeat protein